jgi:SagB-type dehydrogenase family enzyme
MKYQLSPTVRFNRIAYDRSLQVELGSGDTRTRLSLETDNPVAFYDWLLTSVAPMSFEDLRASASKDLGLDDDGFADLLTQLVEFGILVDAETRSQFDELVARWSAYGWRDAADFHVAYHNLTFLPDNDGGETYRKLFSELLANPGTVGDQPEHYAPKATRRALAVAIEPLDATLTLEEVLRRGMPVNKFVGPAPDLESIMAGMTDAVAAQRVVGGSLGAHQQRSYPSGGARHPFEAYVVSKGIEGLPAGAYWFDPLTHELHPRDSAITAEAVDAACFGKGGVVSSKVCIAITCRWLRHSWKYRYARSYRMILLELGHMIQAINLSMRARNVDIYQCPSINDSKWLELLDLDDDGQEGPMYVLGLGRDGRI